MENNELRQTDAKGPSRWPTIIFLVGEALLIVWVSLALAQARQFTKIFEEMEIGQSLPFITVVFVGYWYLWIILLLLLLAAGILIEVFVNGKRRWINIVLSSFTIGLCFFIGTAFILAIWEPLVVLMIQLAE